MGMFDSVMLKVKAPCCGTEQEIECQTKEFSCRLAVWRKGDYIDDKVKAFDCICECENPGCRKPLPDVSNFFNIRVFLRRGKVTGKYNII